ncbi:MAG: protein kinase [Myxococcales bacterium]|nr:protein kinase [Myxococcales bacterium]
MERIGEYLVRRLVGEGGMGKVYEAEERLSKRRVALKVLRPELARSEDGRRLFLNEMTILAHLDHPNIVRSLACTETDGQLVMALEFLEGHTLRELLTQRGRLDWAEALSITNQVASALAVAHRQEPPIIHRDLKPENIMVLPSGKVKVMDFGIAKVLEALSRTTTQSVGTLQYMSPEQIDAVGVDARSDLYCLGLILYEMLAGVPPFESASPRELLNLQCTAPPPELPEDVRRGLPRGIERLLYELLEKSPDDRPGSALDVLHDIEPFAPADGIPVSATRSSGAGAPGSDPASDGPARRSQPSSDRVSSDRRPSGAARDSAPREAAEPRGDSPARRAAERDLPHNDTIALVERATEQRQISTPLALAVVVVLSLVAGGVTYLIKSHRASQPSVAPSAAIPAGSPLRGATPAGDPGP